MSTMSGLLTLAGQPLGQVCASLVAGLTLAAIAASAAQALRALSAPTLGYRREAGIAVPLCAQVLTRVSVNIKRCCKRSCRRDA